MEINFFLQSKDFGGAEKFASDLIVEMAKRKQKVFFYTSNNHLLKNLIKHQNIELRKIPIYLDFAGNRKGLLKSLFLSLFAEIFYFKTILEISQRTNKQIIICSGFNEKIIVTPLAKLFNLPVYFIEYGPLEPLFEKLYGVPKFLYFFSKKFVTKVVVPSINTSNALQKVFAKDKMILIPCGSKNEILNLSNKVDQETISVVSRLEKGKGQDLLIKAFFLVKKEFPKAKLQIIGDGSFFDELKKLSNNDPQIIFLKYLENKQAIIEKSEVIVCPSVWPLEGFGLTIIEAMNLAKPIVAFDRAPGNEILANEQTAFLAKNGDYQDLAKKIILLLKNKNLQKKIANTAKKVFQEKYQIEKIAEQYLDLLQN